MNKFKMISLSVMSLVSIIGCDSKSNVTNVSVDRLDYPEYYERKAIKNIEWMADKQYCIQGYVYYYSHNALTARVKNSNTGHMQAVTCKEVNDELNRK